MAPSTTDAARHWRDARAAYGDDAAQALAAFARMRKSGGDFADGVVTAKIPHIPEHALAAGHGRSGEGSRGGNIVRHTASGHAVYGPSIGGRTRKTSLPVDVLRQAAARSKAKAEDRHRQMSDAEREFAEGPNTVRRPYRTLHEEVYGEPLGKARRVKPGAGQGVFEFTAAPAAPPAPAAPAAPAAPRAPAGYEPIPYSKHGGWRKPKASGGYRYWYRAQQSLMGPYDEHSAEQEYAHRRAHHAVQASQHEAQADAATHQEVKDAHRHAEAKHRDVLRAMKQHEHGSALPKQPHDRDSESADRQTSNADDVETAAKEGRLHDALPPGTWSRDVHSQASAWGGKLAQVTKLSSHGGMSAGYDPVSRTRGYIVRMMVDGDDGKPIDADPDDPIMGHVLGTHVKVDRPDQPYSKVAWQVGTPGYGTVMRGRYGEPELHLVAVKTKDLQPAELVALRSHLQDDRRFVDVAGHGHGAMSQIKEKEWRQIFAQPSFDATQELPAHLANAADTLVQRRREAWNMPRDSDSEDIWSRIPGIFHSGAKFDTLKFEVEHADPKRVRKGGRAMERDAETLSKGRIGAWVYSGTSDGPMARGIESGDIVVGTLAPMAKGWPLQARPAQTQRLAAEVVQRHDDQAGHWGGGGLAQWWKDTYAGQEHVTVPLWLQQAGLPYGTTTPAVAQRSLTPAEEALARIYQAADARCATGLRVAQAQRAGVKIVAG